jgi:hypothetical protein
VIPGIDEIFALIDVRRHVEGGKYDLLVVDCAPTAETLRLLSLPEIMNWYIERIFPVERRVVKTIRPIVSRMTTLPIAGDQVFSAIESLHNNLDAVRRILIDERVSSVRLVVNPEKMVISEARRTYTYLSLFGYRVDAVVVNRIIPDSVTDPYFLKWKDIQAEHLETRPESFEPLPILTARLFRPRDGSASRSSRDGRGGVTGRRTRPASCTGTTRSACGGSRAATCSRCGCRSRSEPTWTSTARERSSTSGWAPTSGTSCCRTTLQRLDVLEANFVTTSWRSGSENRRASPTRRP